jgi:hypothetical protein
VIAGVVAPTASAAASPRPTATLTVTAHDAIARSFDLTATVTNRATSRQQVRVALVAGKGSGRQVVICPVMRRAVPAHKRVVVRCTWRPAGAASGMWRVSVTTGLGVRGTLAPVTTRSVVLRSNSGGGGGRTLQPDTASPELELADVPAATNGAFTARAVTRDDVAVTSVAFQVDAGAPTQLRAAPWTFWVDPATLAPGEHRLLVVASDASGNSTSRTATFVVGARSSALAPPTLALTRIDVSRAHAVSFFADASDPSGIEKVTFQVDAGAALEASAAPFAKGMSTMAIAVTVT